MKKQKTKRRPLPEKQTDTQIIAGGLATMVNRLVDCGLGKVNLGKLAKHMLKLRRDNP